MMLADFRLEVGPVLGAILTAAVPTFVSWLAYRKSSAAAEAAAIAAKATLAAAANDAKALLDLEALARRKRL